jgi:HAD superfamily hydrolase (TIGR01509 family)
MTRGVVFDVDGVLADTERVSARAASMALRELHGVDIEPAEFLAFCGHGPAEYLGGPAEKAGVHIDLPVASRRHSELFIGLLEESGDIVLPGAHALIDALAADSEWKLCIATSSTREKANATLKAARIPLAEFAACINGSMVTKEKPDPEIYEAAARGVGLSPGQCVGIEDTPAGVRALRAAGMKAIAVTTGFDADVLGSADLIVASLAELTVDRIRDLL